MFKVLAYILLSCAVHACLWLSLSLPAVSASATQARVAPIALHVPSMQAALTVQESQAPAKPVSPASPATAKVQSKPVGKPAPAAPKAAEPKLKTAERQERVNHAAAPRSVAQSTQPITTHRAGRAPTAAALNSVSAKTSTPAKPIEVLSQQPRFKHQPKPPVYPASAKRKNQQGQVLVEVRLTAQGQQQELRIIQSSGVSSLDQAALNAVRGWQFLPELRQGLPVASRVQVPVNFTLNHRR
ncbi:energy transducer TonB [Thiopseudomonas alkaliphila]|uniref:energy transducer TonB n=1 Tax=Thiopseudomonas alkaliphila TaxID=1697053 RepID=UPI00069D242B|nr:energy transducer TonB [Thiopseudomonas alkaliphila]